MNRRADPRSLWTLAIVASPAIEILSYLTFGIVPGWLVWLRLAVLAAVLVVGLWWHRLQPLRAFCFAYGFQQAVGFILATARASDAHRSLVAWNGFVAGQLFQHLLWLGFLSLPVFWLIRRREGFCFRVGDLAAKVNLTRVGLRSSALRWSVLGPVLAIVSLLCSWIFVAATGVTRPGALSMIPWAVLFSCINAFGEEAVNRNLLIGVVRAEWNATHAVLVSAMIFGVDHWRGLPGGPAGIAMTFALALVAGRAMVDTKGAFWPVVMHGVPDCILFYYWGIGTVGHGSR